MVIAVIADDHHHVLPEIHLAIRRRRLPFDEIHIIHFDAHPDLSFPQTADASVVYQPEALYDLLDNSISGNRDALSELLDESDDIHMHAFGMEGIAEFLLPLVFAGHVNRITWIKLPWSLQMPVGSYPNIVIGKRFDNGRVGLTSSLPHFLDEELHCAASDLQKESQKYWDLHVAQLRDAGGESVETLTAAFQTQSKAYVLDIDLDYFSTWNPFWKELEEMYKSEDLATVKAIFSSVRCKRTDIDLSVSHRIEDRQRFLAALAELGRDSNFGHVHRREPILKTMATLYPDDVDAEILLSAFSDVLASFSDDDFEKVIVWAGSNLELPHHESSPDEIKAEMERFRQFLDDRGLDHTNPPALITIAKSTGDEFLPPFQADAVLDQLLIILGEVFGEIEQRVIEYEPVEESEGV